MAHSLSSQQYHNASSSSSSNYQQCSPSSSHHASMYNNYHRSHRAEVQQQQLHGSYQQQQQSTAHGSRLKLSSFKGKSWQSFGEALASESSDDETDNEDPLALPTTSSQSRHSRGSVVRLKRRDIQLYGFCPETDPFAVVTCRHCRKILKSTALKRHIDMRHDPMVKLEKIPEKYGSVEKIEKIKDAVEKISVTPTEKSSKSHRHTQRKSTPSDNSNDATIPMPIIEPQPPPPMPILSVPQQQPQPPPPPLPPQPSESSSASNSPQPRRKKRKQMIEPIVAVPTPTVSPTVTETFQAQAVVTQPAIVTATAAAPPTTCRIIMSSSPPPLAPITTTNEAPPSVWIVTPSPAVIIDGSFVVKPLEATEIDTEIDLKDLKVLKPAVKEAQAETSTQLTASNWYTAQPRPLALNTFNMRKINAQRYVMATQRKLIELNRTLRQDEKMSNAVTKPQPKTWSFIERSQVFIPFRVTH